MGKVMVELVRDNPGVLVWAGIFAITGLVLGINAVMMKRRGLSLRPVAWFAGLMAIVGLPQLAFHLYTAVATTSTQAPHVAALQSVDAAALDAPEQMKLLFGPDVDPELVVDMRTLFPDAEAARMAAFSSGESVILARFPSAGAMEQAWIAYLAAAGLTSIAEGDSERGFAATRPSGDRIYVLPMRTMLGVWTAPNDQTIRQRMAAGGFSPHYKAPLAGNAVVARAADGEGAAQAAAATGASIPFPVQMAGLAFMLLVTSVYFMKGAAWAGATPAAKVTPVSSHELRARILAINDLDVPFAIEADTEGKQLTATWRYADAKWIDVARAHGMRRVHRVVMRLDEGAHAVRVTDFAAAHDWSVGAGGARIAWQRSMGITFFQVEHQRVFGLQIGPDGRFKPALSYAYTFDLHEMKGPLTAAVTQAGWKWAPVLVDAPRWLRWATE